MEWLGQGLAVDAANTVVRERGGHRDLLDNATYGEWLRIERVAPRSAPTLDAFRALRDDVRALLFAAVACDPLPTRALRAVNAASARAAVHAELRRDGTRRVVARGGLLGAIAGSTVDLLGGPDRARLRVCDAPGCGMFFLVARADQHWCSQPCGNRARVARHAARRRAA